MVDGSRTGSIGGGMVGMARCVAGADAVLEQGLGWAFVGVPAALPCRRVVAAVWFHCPRLLGAGAGPFAVIVFRRPEALVYGGLLLLRAHLVVSGPGKLVILNRGWSTAAAKACYSALLLRPESLGSFHLQVLLEVWCRLLRVRLQ